MNDENLWKNLAMAKGGKFQIWSNAPSDPLPTRLNLVLF